jgi:heme exporter protein CcmD
MTLPHFDHYASYIWSAYGVVAVGLILAILYTGLAYGRAKRHDRKE